MIWKLLHVDQAFYFEEIDFNRRLFSCISNHALAKETRK